MHLPIADTLPIPTAVINRHSAATVIFPDGRRHEVNSLLQCGSTNTKLAKSGREWRVRQLSLAPHSLAGFGNVCPKSTKGCRATCLHYAGRASVWPTIHRGRIARTYLWFHHRDWFLESLHIELLNFQLLTFRRGVKGAVRLNVFSDLPWEKFKIPQRHPDLQFYDYTKIPKRAGNILPNYWCTFSRSETNQAECRQALSSGANVAVVFHGLQPRTFMDRPVLDGDKHDLRFLDRRGPEGFIIGLRLKTSTLELRATAYRSHFAVVPETSL